MPHGACGFESHPGHQPASHHPPRRVKAMAQKHLQNLAAMAQATLQEQSIDRRSGPHIVGDYPPSRKGAGQLPGRTIGIVLRPHQREGRLSIPSISSRGGGPSRTTASSPTHLPLLDNARPLSRGSLSMSGGIWAGHPTIENAPLPPRWADWLQSSASEMRAPGPGVQDCEPGITARS